MQPDKTWSWSVALFSLALIHSAACGDEPGTGKDDARADASADGAAPARPDASSEAEVEDDAEVEDVLDAGLDAGDEPDASDEVDAEVDASEGPDAGEEDGGSDTAVGPTLVTTGSVVGFLAPTSDSAYIAALCGYYARCEPTFYPGLTLAECRALLSQPCSAVPWVVLNAEDGADACIERLNNALCTDSFAGDIATGACATAFDHGVARLSGAAAQSAPGAACGDGQGCAIGSVCALAEDSACGTCVGLKAVGATCSLGECIHGGCVAGRCVAPGAEGDACVVETYFGQGSVTYCQPGLYCNGSNRCVKLGAAGAACSDGAQCVFGSCVSDHCVEGLANGAACTSDDACTSGTCFEGRCAVVASCAPGASGEPCTPGSCAAGLYCNAHRCTASAPTDCTVTGCNADSYCDVDAQPPTCTPRKATGATCNRTGQCAEGECQSPGRCIDVGTYGACDENADCRSDVCVDGYCRGGSTCE